MSLTPLTGERQPGPGSTGPLGGFLLPAVMPGDYLLSITAAGYDTIGADPAAGAVTITLDPQPDGLVAGEAANETELVSAVLAPTASCPTPLKPPNPNLPDLAGLVRNAATGLPITTAQETLAPTTGGKPPNPNVSFFGAFAWWSLDPGGYTLSVSAPGYLGIGIPTPQARARARSRSRRNPSRPVSRTAAPSCSARRSRSGSCPPSDGDPDSYTMAGRQHGGPPVACLTRCRSPHGSWQEPPHAWRPDSCSRGARARSRCSRNRPRA